MALIPLAGALISFSDCLAIFIYLPCSSETRCDPNYEKDAGSETGAPFKFRFDLLVVPD